MAGGPCYLDEIHLQATLLGGPNFLRFTGIGFSGFWESSFQVFKPILHPNYRHLFSAGPSNFWIQPCQHLKIYGQLHIFGICLQFTSDFHIRPHILLIFTFYHCQSRSCKSSFFTQNYFFWIYIIQLVHTP